MANKLALEDQVARLTALVDEMRLRMANLEGVRRPPGAELTARSRRDLLKLGGAAALGVVGAAALRAVPASAATTGTMLLGEANVAENPTTLQGDGGTPPTEVLGVEAAGFNSALLTAAGTFAGPLQGLGTTGAVEGVDGFASGNTAFGVYGLTDSGTGVVGESSTGISLYARGSGRLLQDPMPAGTPAYTPNTMEQVRDVTGTLWLSNDHLAWRRASTFEVFGNPRRVYGPGVAIPAAAFAGDPSASVLNIDATTQIAGSPWNGAPSGVPLGASAAWCAVQATEPGVLSIYPAGATDPGKASWASQGTAGKGVNMLYMMVPLSASGRFSFTNYFTSKHVYIDVWGFLSA